MANMSSTLSVSGHLDELETVSRWLDATTKAWDISGSVTFNLQLCCEELVSNAVRHGLGTSTPACDAQDHLLIRLSALSEILQLDIEDRGPPFDPTKADEPVMPDNLESAKIGGLGIHLARQFSDSMLYERIDGTNRVSLTFKVPQ
jgi:sigma-B regulation protein RsbU (phosphoserine phosphatase)